MDFNPWRVESIQEFSFLKCPECAFDSKQEDSFENHAMENPPLSFIQFVKSVKEECSCEGAKKLSLLPFI